MEALAAFIRFEAWLLLGGLAFVVAFQTLTGKINTRKMLFGKGKNGGFSPGRTQLLVVTLTGALFYITEVASNGTLADVPPGLLAVVGGSNLAYLGGKGIPVLRSLLGLKTESGGRKSDMEGS